MPANWVEILEIDSKNETLAGAQRQTQGFEHSLDWVDQWIWCVRKEDILLAELSNYRLLSVGN
jgi:hypothetical protein